MNENISCMMRNPILYCMVLCAALLSLIPFPVMGEMKTVTHTVKQPFGGD
ncbi:MAG: hypothetical protein NTX36_02340 [Proteobacteria bacterium]|nr:hypothetical protein [Pseudomonadota bacterium]